MCLCRHGDGCMVGCGLEPSGGQLSDNLWCAALSNAMKLWSYVWVWVSGVESDVCFCIYKQLCRLLSAPHSASADDVIMCEYVFVFLCGCEVAEPERRLDDALALVFFVLLSRYFKSSHNTLHIVSNSSRAVELHGHHNTCVWTSNPGLAVAPKISTKQLNQFLVVERCWICARRCD